MSWGGMDGNASFARVSLQLSEALDAGLPLNAAWESILHRKMEGEDRDLPRELLEAAQEIPFPGIAIVVREIPYIIQRLWTQEKKRNSANRERQKLEGARIADFLRMRVAADAQQKKLSTLVWWKRRSVDGQRLQRSAKMLIYALKFTRIMGSSPAQVLRTISASIDEENRLEQQRHVSQSGPELSRRILTTLPLLGMLGAYILGINPIDFFFHSGTGHIVGASGLLFAVSGFVWMKRMVTKAIRARQRLYDIPLALDLSAAALTSGASIPDLLHGLGQSFTVPELCETSTRLMKGATWWDAWEKAPIEFLPLAFVLENSWTGGALAAETLRTQAARERQAELAILAGEAQKLGIRLLIPLGLTLLPAFILLGIVPVIAYIAHGSL